MKITFHPAALCCACALAGLSAAAATNGFSGFQESPAFNERVASFTLEPEVKVQINAPGATTFDKKKKVLLIIYTLPNGNSIAQTIGRKVKPDEAKLGDNWRFEIQHIGAQTRFLRQLLPDRNVVVAYLEANAKTIPRSWPTWRKKNGDAPIPGLVASICNIFPDEPVEIVLSGHSGGGSFIFGYLNAMKRIPDEVVRIAFLDSNYAYDPALGHGAKLCQWLDASPRHHLCVLAYNDAAGLLNGKPFVSAAGGTWGRSHAMLKDLGAHYNFTHQALGQDLEKVTALDGQIEFFLKENPKREILHTVQVARNGFIEAMVSGTTNEGQGFQYYGNPAYGKWIQSEDLNMRQQR